MGCCKEAPAVSQEVDRQLDEVIARHKDEPGALLEILHEAQRIFGYLSDDVLTAVSKKLGIHTSEAYGVATFYSLLSTKPKGKNIIRVCVSGPCHVMGSDSIVRSIEDELQIGVGETTADGLFTLETTSCLGVCSDGPAMMINDKIFGNLTREKVRMILRSYAEEKEASVS
jgi:NADH-quinone oxidoreductase E subunit